MNRQLCCILLLTVLGLCSVSGVGAHPATPDAQGANANLLLNPDFEYGFADWTRLADPRETQTAIDTTVAHSGQQAARIMFGGSPVNYYHLNQEVDVAPRTTYRLTGYLKTESLQTIPSGGVALEVQDGRLNGWDYLVADTNRINGLGTHDWIPITATFTTTPETTRIRVFLRRAAPETPEYSITGTVWFDDLALVKLPPLIEPDHAVLKMGQTQKLAVSNGKAPYAWQCSDPTIGTLAVASDDSTRATFTARLPGRCTLTVTDANGEQGAASLTVVAQSVIAIDADQIARAVPERMFGSNVEYDFGWPRVVTDTGFIADTKQLRITSLRYPGGLLANAYDFSAGQGWTERDECEGERAQQFNCVGVDTDGFLRFAQATGIPNLTITANVFRRGNPSYNAEITPQVAADWVRHTNLTRGQRVAYWELGNEISGLPNMSLNRYLSIISEWSSAMKAADPSIKIGAVVLDPAYGRGYDEEAWDISIIQQRANDIDFLVTHPYVNILDYLDHGSIIDETARKTFAWIYMTHQIGDLRRWLDLFAPERSAAIEIQASEWNLFHLDLGRAHQAAQAIPIYDTLLNTVLNTDLLWDMVQEGAAGANIWNLAEVPWPTLEPAPGGKKYAQYHMLDMNRNRSGDLLLRTRVLCPTYDTGSLTFNGETYFDHVAGIPALAAYATKTADDRRLYLIVTNKSSEPEKAVIALAGFAPQAQASVWQMTSTAWGDTGVTPEISTIQNAGPAFSFTFPARSVTNITLLSSDKLTYKMRLPLIIYGSGSTGW